MKPYESETLSLPASETQLVLAGPFHERLVGPADDAGIHAVLHASGGHYETNLQAFLARTLSTDDVCIDVGANLGIHTLQLARTCPAGTVHAFEPNPAMFPFLAENVRLANADHVTPHQLAVGSEDATITMYASAHHPGGSHIGDPGIDALGGDLTAVDVKIRALDSFVAREAIDKVDLVKVDIEGHELEFLAGAQRTLTTHKPTLVMECNPVALRHLAGAAAADLYDGLVSIYGRVGYLDEHGNAIAIRSTGHLHDLLRSYGLIDLVAGADLLGGRRTYADSLKARMSYWTHTVAREEQSVVRRIAARVVPRPDRQPYLWAPRVDVATDPTELEARPSSPIAVDVTITNRAGWIGPEGPLQSIRIGYRLFDDEGTMREGTERAHIRSPLPPGTSTTVALRFTTPADPGRYRVHVTLVQEGYVWFDNADHDASKEPANHASLTLDVLTDEDGKNPDNG